MLLMFLGMTLYGLKEIGGMPMEMNDKYMIVLMGTGCPEPERLIRAVEQELKIIRKEDSTSAVKRAKRLGWKVLSGRYESP